MRELRRRLPATRVIVLTSFTDDEHIAFRRRLGAMEREGELMRNRAGAICVMEKLDRVGRRGIARRFAHDGSLPISGSHVPPRLGEQV